MLKDFADLLGSLATGMNKRKPVQLTPGQSAVSAMHEGAHDTMSMPVNAMSETGGMDSANRQLVGLDRFVNAQPLDSTPMPQDGGRDLGDSDKLKALKTAGLLSPGISDQVNTVQPDEPETNTMDNEAAEQPAPRVFGLDQTEQGDDTTASLASRPRVVDGAPVTNMNPIDSLRAQIQDALTVKPQGKWGTFRDIGSAALQGVNNDLHHTNQPIIPYSEMQRQRKLRGLVPQLDFLQQAETEKQNAIKVQQEGIYRNAQAAKLYADADAQNAAIKHQQTMDAQAGQKWTKLISANKIYKQFPDGHTEAWIDPVTNTQGVDKTLVKAKVPGTNETVDVEPSVKLNNATNLAVGDMTRTQQTNQFNADKDFETQKTNVANILKYNDDVRNVITKMADANAQILAANPGLAAHTEKARALADQAAAIAENFNSSTDADERKALQKQMDNVQKQIGDTQNDFYKALGSVQGGQELVKQLKSAMPKKPSMITYKPITPVTSGKPVPASKDPMGLFR